MYIHCFFIFQLCDKAKAIRDLTIQVLDINGDNVLLSGNEVKLIDLGSAMYVDEPVCAFSQSSPEAAIGRHVAPEIFTNQRVHWVSQIYLTRL